MGQQPSTPKITAQDKAIFQLKQQRDKLKQYQKRLNTIIEKQTDLAKKAVLNKQPQKAKFYLRSKKQQESVINTTFDQLNNLEKLIGTIEYKLIEKDVVYGLQQGNRVLQKLNNEMQVEKIYALIDQLEDEKLKVDEVSELLGGANQLNRSEEEEVDQEFENLQKEIHGKNNQAKEEGNELPKIPDTKPMPDAPNTEIGEYEPQNKTSHEPIAI